MKTLTVDLGDRSYPIFIGSGLFKAEYLHPYIKGNQVCVVTNETISPLYLEKLQAQLADYQVSVVTLPDGEQFKSLEYVNHIFDRLLADKHNRTTTVIALGGGVVGDMSGFAAASYQRGVNFIQVPTTLLSQVDSSVGGKTGVNHTAGKNMIGAFHQPQAVIIDTDVLASLPDRELSAGIAEVLKYGFIYDAEFLTWLEGNLDALLKKDADTLQQAIYRSCEIKAEVVAQDEREAGIRAWLNLGHTFGHAIEAHQGYGNWLHGEAVAAGTVMASDLSMRLGWISENDHQRVKRLLKDSKLPIEAPSDMTPEDFLQLMAVDKKVINGALRLVLLKSIGEAVVTSDFPIEQLQQTLESTIASSAK